MPHPLEPTSQDTDATTRDELKRFALRYDVPVLLVTARAVYDEYGVAPSTKEERDGFGYDGENY